MRKGGSNSEVAVLGALGPAVKPQDFLHLDRNLLGLALRREPLCKDLSALEYDSIAAGVDMRYCNGATTTTTTTT